MKINMYKPEEKEILELLSQYKEQLPAPPDYPLKYRENWMTLEVEENPTLIVVKEHGSKFLAEKEKPTDNSLFFINPPVDHNPKSLEIGDWISPSKNKKYIIGRNPGLAREAYYISIKPDGSSDKRDTGVNVPFDFSRIQFAVRDIDEEITQITNIGYGKKFVYVNNLETSEIHRLLI